MLQFIFGVLVGSILGIFIMSIVSVAKTHDQDISIPDPDKTANSTEMDEDV